MRRVARLRQAITGWWTFRDVRGYDPEYAAAGEASFLIIGTQRWFKRCLVIEVDRDEIALLAEMIRDAEDDPAMKRGAR